MACCAAISLPARRIVVRSLTTTSDWSDLDKAVALVRVPARMKQTRILAVGPLRGTAAARDGAQVKKKLGKLYTGRQNPTDPGDINNALRR